MRWRWCRVSIGMLVPAMLLVDCGVATTAGSEQAVRGRPTPTATPRPSPSPTPSPTANTGPFVACDPQAFNSPHFLMGDLVVEMNLGRLAYPGRKLPDGLGLKTLPAPGGARPSSRSAAAALASREPFATGGWWWV
jgi:hypothetical protein